MQPAPLHLWHVIRFSGKIFPLQLSLVHDVYWLGSVAGSAHPRIVFSPVIGTNMEWNQQTERKHDNLVKWGKPFCFDEIVYYIHQQSNHYETIRNTTCVGVFSIEFMLRFLYTVMNVIHTKHKHHKPAKHQIISFYDSDK